MKKIQQLNDFIIDFLKRLKKEGNETSEAAVILSRYAKGEEVSKEDMDKFRNQMIDVIKVLGIGIPFTVIPGSSLLLPLVISIAKKYNIRIVGLHQHIGSNLKKKDKDLFIETSKFIFQIVKLFPDVKHINIGGGMGVKYRKYE